MTIAIASDHAGFDFKNKIIEWLKGGIAEVTDFGCWSEDSVDYPDFAFAAADAVAKGEFPLGIIICGTGIGVNITANKIEGIRAANCCTVEMAQLSREHNNANILNLGARLISINLAQEIIKAFISTDFAGGRHQIRVDKIHSLTNK